MLNCGEVDRYDSRKWKCSSKVPYNCTVCELKQYVVTRQLNNELKLIIKLHKAVMTCRVG